LNARFWPIIFEKVGPSKLPAYWLLKTIVDATLIAVPPSTKNKVKKRA